jgi:hypothetical protein
MQRDQSNGRFTTKSRPELKTDREEEDEINGALRGVEQQRQNNGTGAWGWNPETPMPGIEEEPDTRTGTRSNQNSRPEFAALTAQELEATVEAARKRNEYIEELTELEKQIQGTGRKLFAESTKDEEEDNLEEVEEMLMAFGDGEDVADNLDALERLHAGVSVERLQPNLFGKLGLKKPIGTMDKLAKEIQSAYPKEVELLKKVSRTGGKEVVRTVKKMMSTIMVGTGIKKVLMAMVVTKFWSAEESQRYSRAVKDVTQSLCRVASGKWSELQAECERGEVRHALLTDDDVSKCAGFKLLRVSGDQSVRQLGDSWMGLVVMTASLLGYVAVEEETAKHIMDDWRITNSSHKDCQKEGVSIREMLTDLRGSLKDCRDRLKRIGKQNEGPDDEDLVQQMMLAPKLAIQERVRDKMRSERLHKKDVTLKDAVRLLIEAEDDLTIDRYNFESTKAVKQNTPSQGGAGGQRSGGAGGSGRAPLTDYDKAVIVFASQCEHSQS